MGKNLNQVFGSLNYVVNFNTINVLFLKFKAGMLEADCVDSLHG